jgi:hypothetical protein
MKKTNILKRLYYLPTVFIAIMLMGFSCDRDHVEAQYEFRIDIQVTPERITYQVGDTIHLKYKIIDNRLEDLLSGSPILLGNVDLPLRVYFGKRTVEEKLLTTPNAFSTVVNNVPDSLIRRTENGQYTELRYSLTCDMMQGELEVDMLCVLQKSGIYKIEVWKAREFSFNGKKDCSSNYQNPYAANLTYKLNVVNTNYQLMEKSPVPSNVINVTDYPEDEKTQDRGIFWIEVED